MYGLDYLINVIFCISGGVVKAWLATQFAPAMAITDITPLPNM